MNDKRVAVTVKSTSMPRASGRSYWLTVLPRIGEAFVDDDLRMRVTDVVHFSNGSVQLHVVPDAKS